jgi:hypothetical protein
MILSVDKGSIQKINRPTVTLSTTIPTWPEIGSNLGFHGDSISYIVQQDGQMIENREEILTTISSVS